MKYMILEGVRKMKRDNMKKAKAILLLVMLAALLALPLNAQAASTKSKAIKAYKAFLAQAAIPWGRDSYYTAVPTKRCQFSLVYIDKNSVPELVVKSDYVTHAAGCGVVFTYKNGKVQPVENIHLDGDFYYYKKKGVYAASYLGTGRLCYNYDKMSGLSATAKLSDQKDILSGKKSYYKITSGGSKAISRKKFNSVLKKLVGSAKKTKAKFYKNTKKNRAKYLK